MYFSVNSDNALIQKANAKSMRRIIQNAPVVDVPEKIVDELTVEEKEIEQIKNELRKLSEEKSKVEDFSKKTEVENKSLKTQNEEVKKELKKKAEAAEASQLDALPSGDKAGIAGGIAGLVSTAMDQLTGSGDFTPDPNNPPGPTLVDKVKDQVVGLGEFEVPK